MLECSQLAAGRHKDSALQQPLDSGSDHPNFASTSESEDEQMGSELDADVRSQDGEADMDVATTSGETATAWLIGQGQGILHSHSCSAQ